MARLLQVRARHGIERDAPLILSVGRLIPQKGPDILVGALAKLLESHPDVVVVLVGESALLSPCGGGLCG
jgi:glycosyltransferase involved in cell wall biosynthesis